MDSAPEQPILNIVGEKVALGPLRRELLPLHYRWANDFAVTRTIAAFPQPRPMETQEEWYARASRGDGGTFFIIYERGTGRPIGATSLEHIEQVQRIASFTIFIGEKEYWAKGYGTEATRLTLDYGFTVLGLHNIMLIVYSFNERGLRAYLRAGFTEIGRRRQAHRLAGKVSDVADKDCLATEFDSPVLRGVLEPQP